MNNKIAVLGAGAWGTAVASLLADNGTLVSLWSYEQNVAYDINTTRLNTKYLPNIALPTNIIATNNMHDALEGASTIFQAIPVAYLRSILQQVKHEAPSARFATWVILSKGIEQHTSLLPSQILEDVFGSVACVVVAGPNFAHEVAHKLFTATIVASSNQQLAKQVADLLCNRHFKTFISSDIMGVQAGSAVKNVIALAVGMARGAGYGDNTRAYIITQGLHEMTLLAEFYKGHKETIYGISGLGDLVLTCSSETSKNMRIGKKLGSGMTLKECAQYMPTLPEGINSVQTLHSMIMQNHLLLPLCRATYDCIFNGESFKHLLENIVTQ